MFRTRVTRRIQGNCYLVAYLLGVLIGSRMIWLYLWGNLVHRLGGSVTDVLSWTISNETAIVYVRGNFHTESCSVPRTHSGWQNPLDQGRQSYSRGLWWQQMPKTSASLVRR